MREMTLFISNSDLALNRQVEVEATMKGVDLSEYIHKALELKESVSALGGRMRLDITYQLFQENSRLDESEQSLADLGVVHNASIQIRIFVTQRVGHRVSTPVDYRHSNETESLIPSRILKRLLRTAFSHLVSQDEFSI